MAILSAHKAVPQIQPHVQGPISVEVVQVAVALGNKLLTMNIIAK
jgi:hypothetical protein